MKRIVAVVSFAMLAVPAVAAETGAPYEVTQFNRGLSNDSQRIESAAGGQTGRGGSVWMNDFGFIAPPQ